MPLTRANITAASRTMLPTYPVFAGAIGLNFMVRGEDLVPVGVFYEVADRICPLPVWGAAFIAVALVQVVALLRRRRWSYEVGLALMVGLMLVWSAVGVMAAIMDTGSWTAPLWPGFVAVACLASFRSLNAGEK